MAGWQEVWGLAVWRAGWRVGRRCGGRRVGGGLETWRAVRTPWLLTVMSVLAVWIAVLVPLTVMTPDGPTDESLAMSIAMNVTPPSTSTRSSEKRRRPARGGSEI